MKEDGIMKNKTIKILGILAMALILLNLIIEGKLKSLYDYIIVIMPIIISLILAIYVKLNKCKNKDQ